MLAVDDTKAMLPVETKLREISGLAHRAAPRYLSSCIAVFIIAAPPSSLPV